MPGPRQIPFAAIRGQREEVEVVGVFQHLLREIGLWRRERGREVGDRLALSLEEIRLDLVDEHCARPAVFEGLQGVPET